MDNWKHRSKFMICRACMWYVKKHIDNVEEKEMPPCVGRCRKHAPTMNGFPVVFENDYCGDHKIDENKI